MLSEILTSILDTTMNSKFSFRLWIFTLLVCLLPMACSDSEKNAERAAPTENTLPASQASLPSFKIVDENVSDTPMKTQVEQHIVVSGQITDGNLHALLRQRHTEISNRRGFQHHNSPTNIYVYLYETEDKAKAGQGLWLAMSQMSYGETEPKLTVRTDQIARLGQKPQEKFGLTEAERQEAFMELARLEKKATDEAIERYPSDINKQIDLEGELQEKYKDELAARYSLTRDQLQSIMVEGVTNQWKY